MMFSTFHCWSRTPPGRGGWMRTTQRNWMPATMRAESTKWRRFVTARSMRRSQNQIIYRGSTIWYHGGIIRKKKIPGGQLQRFSTLGSSSAHSTTIIQISRQRPPRHRHRPINGQVNHPASSQNSYRAPETKRGRPANSANKRAKKS